MTPTLYRTLAALTLGGLGLLGANGAEASPLLPLPVTLTPSETSATTGDAVTLDVSTSGLAAPLGAFDIFISYNPALLSFNAAAASFGLSLGDTSVFEAIGFAQISTPGVIEVAETSLLATSDLAAVQAGGPPFDLADLPFTALGTGPVTFDLVSAVGVTADAVPEPASWAMLLACLPLVAWQRRRRRAG
jgi:hypothetical protein